MDWVWPEAERLGVPVALMASNYMSMVAPTIAEKHPRLKLIVDHLGRVGGTTRVPVQPWVATWSVTMGDW
jgi:predicted TIM-barrel fold metal-dependent hydrolase